ncbi:MULTISPECIES: hypothetical protein [unclassified Bradyrhizobium]
METSQDDGRHFLCPDIILLFHVRRYLDQTGNIVEISATVHPADRFTFSMRLRRDRSA